MKSPERLLGLRSIQPRARAFIASVALTLALVACGAGDDQAEDARRDDLNPPQSEDRSVTACSERDDSCKYIRDMLLKSPDFYSALLARLAAAGIQAPDWLFNGTESPLQRLALEGRTQVFGFVCEPHNCRHSFYILYDPEGKAAKGLYVVGEKTVWFGTPSTGERAWLCKESLACMDVQAS